MDEMSWQEYVDTLTSNALIKKAAIVGHDGSLWATSADLRLTGDEVSGAVRALSNTTLAHDGLQLEGEKYVLLRGDEQELYLRTGKGGAVLAKTGQCVLMGFFEGERHLMPNAFKVVEDLADYLRSVGY